jgi:DUF4097 and DUF4098 domain-containing protein YvlB
VVLAVGVGHTAVAQQAERYEVAGQQVAIYNLVGEVTVEGGTGSSVMVQVRRGGGDAGQLAVERGPIGSRQTLRVIYPADRIIYRAASGWQGSSQLRVREDGTFGDWGDRDRRERGREVEIRSRGTGLEAYADLTIAVPKGQRLEVYLAAGRIGVTNVDGALRLDGGAAEVTTSHTTGELVVDVGSGAVQVSDARGSLNLDTGSGEVNVTGASGEELLVDTGSGSVTVRDATATTMSFDTGSGAVEGTGLAADVVGVDTGSGEVDLAFTRAPRDINIDTGSGGVTLTVPANFSAQVNISTGSGGIDLDFPVQVSRWERDAVRGTIGDGTGRLTVETGSGGIRIRKT